MTDQVQTPGEQGNPSPAGDAVNTQRTGIDTPKYGDTWEARYKGLVPTVDKLTARARDLETQLAAKTSETEQLKAQLGLKDTEKTAAIGERDRQLQEAVQKATTLETELSDLRALKLKIDVARELKRPDLIKIADNLPNMTDREALKTVLANFANFADEAVREREQQLLSGITPGINATQATVANSLPSSEGDWMKFIESKPMGSPERDKAWGDYWSFLEAKNKSK